MDFKKWINTPVKKKHVNRVSISDKLIKRLNTELNMHIPLGTSIKQINPTINQLSRGSFKWVFEGNFSSYGSTCSISELLKAKELEISYTGSGGLSNYPSSLRDIQPAS